MAAKGDPLAGLQLPDFPGPTVMLYAGAVAGNSGTLYENLLAFAADACGVTPQRLCALDLEKYRADHDLEPRDLVSAYSDQGKHDRYWHDLDRVHPGP